MILNELLIVQHTIRFVSEFALGYDSVASGGPLSSVVSFGDWRMVGYDARFDVLLTMSQRLDCIINLISLKASVVGGTLRIMNEISIRSSTIQDASFSYRVYIVRCWEEQASGLYKEPISRFSLDIPTTGERCGFVNQDALLEALRQELHDAKKMESAGNGCV